jgi:hypothetical protein
MLNVNSEGSEDGMRHRGWARAVLGLIVIAGGLALAARSAPAQMCTPLMPAIPDCERQADADARQCFMQCTRYDTICSDRCDDTHDTVVRYCWIKAALCRVSQDSQGLVRASNQRK